MKLEFLYTDESYKEKIKDIKIGDSVTLSHTNESNLYIFHMKLKERIAMERSYYQISRFKYIR